MVGGGRGGALGARRPGPRRGHFGGSGRRVRRLDAGRALVLEAVRWRARSACLPQVRIAHVATTRERSTTMRGFIRGTHHLTFCVGGAQEDYDFHVRLLGLKSVKKTVLFDGEIPIYHLYYGNKV